MRLGDGSTAQQALRFRTNDGDWQIGSNNEGNGTNDNQLFVYNVDDSKIHMCIQRGTGNISYVFNQPIKVSMISVIQAKISRINNGEGIMDNGKGTK